jgi:hypothetical protein
MSQTQRVWCWRTATNRNFAKPFVTEAVFVFGEIAQSFAECKCRFGHAKIIPAQSLWA